MSTRSFRSRRRRLSGCLALAFLPLVAFGTANTACSDAPAAADTGTSEDDLTKRGKIRLLVTVDWEGRDLTESNLRAIENLRERFPQVKLVQFLNAAYFTKPGANAGDVTARIERALRPGDEHGLHIHGWKRLFEAAGVPFRTTPTFWGTTIDARSYTCSSDCGHEVAINAYTTDELRKVVRFSLDTLEANGFGRAKSFRAGGWVASENVRDAIAAEGLGWDHSEVPTPFLQPKLGTLPLYGWLGDIWPDAVPTSQPHGVDVAEGALVEVPDNGAMADYVSTEQMVDVFEQNKAAFAKNGKKDVVVSIGFHQETAATYLPALEGALERIYDEAAAERLPLESTTSAALKTR